MTSIIEIISKNLPDSRVEDLAKLLYENVEIRHIEEAKLKSSDCERSVISAFSLIEKYKALDDVMQKWHVNVEEIDASTGLFLISVIGEVNPIIVESVNAQIKEIEAHTNWAINRVIQVDYHPRGEVASVAFSSPNDSLEYDDMRTLSHNKEDLRYHFTGDSDVLIFQVFISVVDVDIAKLYSQLVQITSAVDLVVNDLDKMNHEIDDLCHKIKDHSEDYSVDRTREFGIEIANFLQWLQNGNFTILAYACCETASVFDICQISNIKTGPYGLFKSSLYQIEDVLPRGVEWSILHEEGMLSSHAKISSVVLRHDNPNCFFIKSPASNNDKYNRFYVIVGFFNPVIYSQQATDIPIIRKKVGLALARHRRLGNDYALKEGLKALQFYPRAELLQMSEEEVYQFSRKMAMLALMPSLKVFIYRYRSDARISVLLFLPRLRFSGELREKIEELLFSEFDASQCKRYVQIDDTPLVRLHIVLLIDASKIKDKYDTERIQKEIEILISKWEDLFLLELQKKLGSLKGLREFKLYSNSFPSNYVINFTGAQAVKDLEICKKVLDTGVVQYNFANSIKHELDAEDSISELRVYTKGSSQELSSILPLIENLGLVTVGISEYKITANNNAIVYMQYLTVRPKNAKEVLLMNVDVRHNLEVAMAAMHYGMLDNDSFNGLILYAGFSWRESNVMRAIGHYLKQAGIKTLLPAIANMLISHSGITKLIMELFHFKFTSGIAADKHNIDDKVAIILEKINKLVDANVDFILRSYVELIFAMERTSYSKTTDGKYRSYVSFKINSARLKWLPLPKPKVEIFVYSSDFEGVHLRGGKIARGGLRWSDRHDDYRDEILGLMKAQITKNSVIVPTGAKGGFIIKFDNHGDQKFFMNKVIKCYKLFLSGLLDLTDNLVNNKIIKPSQVICYDDVDPYLVVAADKGTATFSDFANAVSAEYKFWMSDAFASGGSLGYSHKALGITVAGAWVLLKQHCARLGIDPDKDLFTVVGIGDMSGDVFGNGMLKSRCIKLIAAFNHLHIFIDPNPNVEKSYLERERLFYMERSQWSDYNVKLISKGGGVFSRSDKNIIITDEMRVALGITGDVHTMTPEEMISCILKAPVDLLWNGGIGTYVKSSAEINDYVADSANDGVRVNGKDLRCRIVSEGGNLGFTQLGRVEYSRQGGLINTDFIDNSSGVDCSDHEVNIKLGLADAMSAGVITMEERNQLLTGAENEVVAGVLEDNRLQGQLLDIEESQSISNSGDHVFLMGYLEANGNLVRQVEYLPSVEEMQHLISNNLGLTRPELAVLISYSKNHASSKLKDIDFCQDPYYKKVLLNYFPKTLKDNGKISDYLLSHKLANDLIKTEIVNDFVNTMGSTLFQKLTEFNENDPRIVIDSFIIAKYGLKISECWKAIEDSLGKISNEVRMNLFAILQVTLRRVIDWLVHNQSAILTKYRGDIGKCISICQVYVNMLLDSYFNNIIAKESLGNYQNDILKLKSNIKEEIFKKFEALPLLGYVFPIIAASGRLNREVLEVAREYCALRADLKIEKVFQRVNIRAVSVEHKVRVAVDILCREIDDCIMNIIIQYMTKREKVEKNTEILNAICVSIEDYLYRDAKGGIGWVDLISVLILIKQKLNLLMDNNIVND